jgi:hypothetical protein
VTTGNGSKNSAKDLAREQPARLKGDTTYPILARDEIDQRFYCAIVRLARCTRSLFWCLRDMQRSAASILPSLGLLPLPKLRWQVLKKQQLFRVLPYRCGVMS